MNPGDDFFQGTFGGFSQYLVEFMPYIIGSAVLIIAFIVFLNLYKPFARNKIKNIKTSGMTFMDIEQMRKAGLLSEEEYRNVRRKVGERELADARRKATLEEQAAILERARLDPDAARELLTPAELAIAQARRAAAEAGEAEPAGAARPPKLEPERPVLRPPRPSMKMPRVLEERRLAQAENQSAPASGEARKAGELEILLKKGAISREEYDRLKKYVK
jgi:uncharacterized membrane protein